MCITKNELEAKVWELRNLKTLKEEVENELKAIELERVIRIFMYQTKRNCGEDVKSRIVHKILEMV